MIIIIRKITFYLAIFFIFVCFLSFFCSSIVLNVVLENKLEYINIFLGFVGSFTGILISAYLIVFSIFGNNPYSRLKKSLYNKYDSYIFLYLLIFILYIIYLLLILENIKVIHLSTLFYGTLISTLFIFYIIFKQIELLDDQNIVKASLKDFSKKNIRNYGLIEIDENKKITIVSWKNNNGVIDPLGGFQEVIQENIDDRLLVKNYLLLLNKRIIYLYSGEEFDIKILAHGLHYLIRLNKNIKEKKGYDVYRKLFSNIIIDLINKTIKFDGKNNIEKLNLLLFAFAKINLDYKNIDFYGSGEPIIDFINLKDDLTKIYSHFFEKIDSIITLIDKKTKYISKSKNKEMVDKWKEYSKKNNKEIKEISLNDIFDGKIKIIK